MFKTPVWLAVGLVAGAAAIVWLRHDAADVPGDSAMPALASGTVEVSAGEHAALMDRVAELEEQISLLTQALDDVTSRLAAESERADTESAVRAAVVRDLEERLAANSQGGPAPGGLAVPPGFQLSNGVLVDQFGNVVTSEGAALGFVVPNIPTLAEVAAAAASGRPMEAPMNLSGIEAEPGQVMVFRVTGSTDGPVWGSDTYTDDSAISAAAVHAGLLRPGETGTIMVTVQQGSAAYPATSRFGVESSGYGEWGRGYAIQRLN